MVVVLDSGEGEKALHHHHGEEELVKPVDRALGAASAALLLRHAAPCKVHPLLLLLGGGGRGGSVSDGTGVIASGRGAGEVRDSTRGHKTEGLWERVADSTHLSFGASGGVAHALLRSLDR
jgi:hypothetical protein